MPEKRFGSPDSEKTPNDFDEVVEHLRCGREREESFRALFERFAPLVERFYRRRVDRVEDQLDLSQEAFLRVYRGIEGFRGESKIGTWIFGICRNVYREWVDQRSRNKEFHLARFGDASSDALERVSDRDARLWTGGEVSPLEGLLREEDRLRLEQAVERLPPKTSRCMRLRLYEEFSYQEIADLMQVKIGTVKAHLHQGRKKVSEELAAVRSIADSTGGK